LYLAASNRWWIGAAHLPFPGLEHLRRDQDRYTWVPVTFTPTDWDKAPGLAFTPAPAFGAATAGLLEAPRDAVTRSISIPHVTAELIVKCITDLQLLGLI
jgi:hypothetical protein